MFCLMMIMQLISYQTGHINYLSSIDYDDLNDVIVSKQMEESIKYVIVFLKPTYNYESIYI